MNEGFIEGANLAIQMHWLNMQKQRTEELAKYRRSQEEWTNWQMRRSMEEVERARQIRERWEEATKPRIEQRQVTTTIPGRSWTPEGWGGDMPSLTVAPLESQRTIEETVNPLEAAYGKNANTARAYELAGIPVPEGLKVKQTDKPAISGVSPEKFTPESLFKFQQSGNYADLIPIETPKEYAPELKKFVKGKQVRDVDMNKPSEVAKARAEGFTEYEKPEKPESPVEQESRRLMNITRASNLAAKEIAYKYGPGAFIVNSITGESYMNPEYGTPEKREKIMQEWQHRTEEILTNKPRAKPAKSKPLDETTAKQILKEAGGDKNKARQIAKQRGFIF